MALRPVTQDAMNVCPHISVAIVVDDERVIADTLAVILRLKKYHVHAAYSGEEALEIAKKIRPDIVLSDIHMQQLNGIQTAVRIRERHPACRIILYSGQIVNERDRARIQELGFEFLQKPLHPRDILEHLGLA